LVAVVAVAVTEVRYIVIHELEAAAHLTTALEECLEPHSKDSGDEKSAGLPQIEYSESLTS